ncbi:inverse autotransporter beta domain-containing protein, partial [Hoeflea sp. YIM 152468]|uniref:inverse autotransporter beta domain-containing protein n=1 Tax=Hoeflea sp. YIM 152468 TaxID=3031759 RepID=UPI0023DAB67C
MEFTAAPGGQRSLAQVNLFAPLAQDADSLLFADLRASAWTGDVQEGNFGVGYRQMVPGAFFGTDAIFGVYGFVDARRSSYGNMFYQGAFGAELITERFEFRANGYLPAEKQYVVGSAGSAVALDGVNIVSTGIDLVERALPGFDVEAGIKIDFSEAAIRLNAGYFRFERGDTLVEGPRFRAEVEIEDPFGFQGAKLSIGGEVRDDKVRGTEVSGLLRLRMPLGGPSAAGEADRALTGLDRLMTRRVYRDEDIVTPVVRQASQSLGPVTDAASGESLQAFFVANTAQGAADCSSVGNACEFVTAQGLAGAGDTFLPVDVAGAIGSVFTLNNDRQQVIGAGDSGSATVVLSDSASSVLIVTSLGGRPIVTGVNIGHFADTRVAGLIANSAPGISGDGFTGSATINDVSSFDGGLNFANSAATLSVTDTVVNNGVNAGIVLSNLTGAAGFDNVDVVSAGGVSLTVDGGSVDATLDSNSSLTQSGAGATTEILNGHTGTLTSGAAISATSGTGLQFNNADGTYNFNGPSNLNGGDTGIDIVNGSTGTFTFGTASAITSPTGVGFNVDGSAANVSYHGTITQNTGASAVSATNNTGGAVTFGGHVTANTADATGINLIGNAGAAFAFSGGLDIDTTSGTGFSATGGG